MQPEISHVMCLTDVGRFRILGGGARYRILGAKGGRKFPAGT